MEMKENVRLSARQQQAINALLTEPTIRAAAAKAAISETTLWRWLGSSDFAQAYRNAQARLLEGMLNFLQAASLDALKVLRDVLLDGEAQASARVSAARVILETTFRARDAVQIEARMAALEAMMRPQTLV